MGQALPPRSYGAAREYLEFVFTAPGAGTSVTVSTGVDGCSEVASITHVGGTNKLTVTLLRSTNKVVDASANVVGTAGARATVGGILNEATSSPLVFDIYTWVAAGTASNDPTAPISVKLALRGRSIGMK